MQFMTPPQWIAERARAVEASGIRKIFDLGRSLKDPVNLSIGQPHFDVPGPVKAAAKDAIDRGLNGYTVTQGAAELRDRLRADVRARFPHEDREVLVTSGTSGGLLLAMLAVSTATRSLPSSLSERAAHRYWFVTDPNCDRRSASGPVFSSASW